MNTQILKKGATLGLCTLFLATSVSASGGTTPQEACAAYLATQTEVPLESGGTIDVSKEDPQKAFEYSTNAIHHGVPIYLLQILQSDPDSNRFVKVGGQKLGDLLIEGKALESIMKEEMGSKPYDVEYFKWTLNTVSMNYGWKGKKTNVTNPARLAGLLCTRHRFAEFRKTLG